MKRTPLHRTQPLRRNRPMKRTSPKNAALKRTHKQARAAYVARVWLCECCLTRRADQCHEITPGPNRLIAFADRRFWLAVCGRCNCGPLAATGKGAFPLARQFALKHLADPAYYDRAGVLEAIGAPASRVTEAEVQRWLRRGARLTAAERERWAA